MHNTHYFQKRITHYSTSLAFPSCSYLISIEVRFLNLAVILQNIFKFTLWSLGNLKRKSVSPPNLMYGISLKFVEISVVYKGIRSRLL